MNRLPIDTSAIENLGLGPDTKRDEPWWSASRAKRHEDDKVLMAEDFVDHYFLVPDGSSPVAKRNTVASLIVNQGTTPWKVVKAVLEWIQTVEDGPYFLTWYTPGALVPTELKDLRDTKKLSTPVKLMLFPGEVDFETESVSGEDAEFFAQELKRHFTYAVLSSYTIDMSTGEVYFFFKREKRLQRLVATRDATHKFLFLDPSKFVPEGEPSYNVADLLMSSSSVTIYTVSSARDGRIKAEFDELAQSLIPVEAKGDSIERDERLLRLRIVGRGDGETYCKVRHGQPNPKLKQALLDRRNPCADG